MVNRLISLIWSTVSEVPEGVRGLDAVLPMVEPSVYDELLSCGPYLEVLVARRAEFDGFIIACCRKAH